MVVFDMAGTTVQDHDEVLHCFQAACTQTGIEADTARLNALMGVSKLEVFHLLWREQLGSADGVEVRANESFVRFKSILEDYYRNEAVVLPTEGALDAFAWCRANDVRIALNTGFYRSVTDIILQKLGWDKGLNAHYIGGNDSIIDFSISSEEVSQGRPAPHMIHKAMQVFGITSAQLVVKIGDTPVDLLEGRNAGCFLSLGVVNGTHSRAALETLDNDGLLDSLAALPAFLESRVRMV
ncbi:MAG: HAD family hydrolase [Saprospiraceae bacterium]